MNTAEKSRALEVRPACPSCGEANAESTKFCSSCGSPLWESCPSCNQSTRIGAAFCGGCGHSLAAEFERRLQESAARLSLAREALNSLDFDEAILQARRVICRDDPRLAQLTNEADCLIDEAQRTAQRWQTQVDQVRDAAESAAKSQNYAAVIELLSPFPQPVLGEALVRTLERARERSARIDLLSRKLRSAIEAKELSVASGLIDELILLAPERNEYSGFAVKIARALLQSAERRFQRGLYAEARARLDTVPESARGLAEFAELRSRIDDIQWLTEQLAQSPFATPTLMRIGKRLVRTAPQPAGSAKLLEQLEIKLRGGPTEVQDLYAAWRDQPRGWAGAPICLLGGPRLAGSRDLLSMRQQPTRFAVALGLALQGIGAAAFEGRLSTATRKMGLRRMLMRPARPSTAWGIDAGASAIRAVRLERAGEQIKVAEAWFLPFEQPLCRTTMAPHASATLLKGLQELATKITASADAPVWASVAARETLGRFLTLPPATEKQLQKILEHEVSSAFPVPPDDLCVTHSIASPAADGSRRAVLVAARRDRIEQREQVFDAAGIKLAGLQADPVALHHFVGYEIQRQRTSDPQAGPPQEAIAVLDGGASGVTFYMACGDAFWFRFVDGGGEELTARLAAACGTSLKVAESLKMNVAGIDPLASAVRAMETQMHQSAARLEQNYAKAAEYFGNAPLKQIFCTGGAPLMHGWVRHGLQTARRA